MRWEDERYVRVYTRDTGDWLSLSFDAQGLLLLLLRKVDRAGILRLGRRGPAALAPMLGHPQEAERFAAALQELLADGCVQLNGSDLVVPNFIEAQEAKTSDAQRKRDQRERDRDKLVADGHPPLNATGLDITATATREGESQTVTGGHAESQAVTQPPVSVTPEVTRGHTLSHGHSAGHAVTESVTPNQPNRAVPSRTEPAKPTSPAGQAGFLRERLEAVFQEVKGHPYAWIASHEDDLRKVVDHGEDEIVRRWRIALQTPYPRCSDVRTLVTEWNSYGAPPPTSQPPKPKDSRRLPVEAERGPVGPRRHT